MSDDFESELESWDWTNPIPPSILAREMIRLSRRTNEATENLKQAGRDYAVAENDYRAAKAKAFLEAKMSKLNGKAPSDAVCEAIRDSKTSVERLAAHTAEGLKVAYLEASRNARAQLSALQTVTNAVIKEIEMEGRSG